MIALWFVARVYLRPHLGRLVALSSLLLVGSALQLVGPQILRQFVDDSMRPTPEAALLGLAVTYCVFAALQHVAGIGEEYAATDLGMRATNGLRQDLFDHCLGLGLEFHQRTPPGALVQRIDQDPALLSNLLSRMATALAGNALIVLGVMVLLCRLDWRVGIVLVGAALVAAMIRIRAAAPVTHAWVRARQAIADFFGDLEELLGGLEDLAGLGASAYAEHRLERGARRQVGLRLRAVLVDSAAQVAETVFALGTTAALGVAVVLHQRGVLSIGDVFLVAAYGGLSLAPLEALGRQLQDLQPAGAAAARVRELLQMERAAREPIHPIPLPAGPLAVEAEDVRFAYADGEEALRGVTFELPAGALLGVVGRTGSGKTTLARLLVRLHATTGGSLAMGGVELSRTALGDLRRRVAYVPQEVHLLGGTLLDNLALFREQVAEEDVRCAVASVGLGDWLDSRPEGLGTWLRAGDDLSAGEAQLLALARVFLQSPGLVVLDEPTARLDLFSQRRLERALDRLLERRTGVIVAHRLETVDRATHVLVLEKGRVAEYGLRSQLIGDPRSQFARLRRGGLIEVLA